MSTSHTVKDISIFSERQLDLVHEKEDVRAKTVCKNFGDDLEDNIEETNKPKLIEHKEQPNHS